jgi:hypothetical protein
MAGGFVAGFLLLGATRKSVRSSRAFQTSHNGTVYASPPVGGSASATARSFRYAPFPRPVAPAHFVGPGNATHFLIRAAKTSQTAGTLCAMCPEILLKILNKIIDKNK